MQQSFDQAIAIAHNVIDALRRILSHQQSTSFEHDL